MARSLIQEQAFFVFGIFFLKIVFYELQAIRMEGEQKLWRQIGMRNYRKPPRLES